MLTLLELIVYAKAMAVTLEYQVPLSPKLLEAENRTL